MAGADDFLTARSSSDLQTFSEAAIQVFQTWDPENGGQADCVTMRIFLFHFVELVLSLLSCPVLFFGSLGFFSLCFSSRVFILFMLPFRSFMSRHARPHWYFCHGFERLVKCCLLLTSCSWIQLLPPVSDSHFQLLYHFHLRLTCGPLPSGINSHRLPLTALRL